MKRLAAGLLGVAVAAVAGALGAAVFVAGGFYDVGSTTSHWQPVHDLLETTMHRSVKRRARGIAAPPMDDPQRLARGAACYREHCAGCHAGPGQAPMPAARSLQPLPGPLVDAPARWTPPQLYWITRHGIKMSGMPAWERRLHDQDLWAVVAFVGRLPGLDRAGYAAAIAQPAPDRCQRLDDEAVPAAPDADRGRALFPQYGCNACHEIPGVTGPRTGIGPPLAGFARQQTIAGRLAHTPDNLVRWLRRPSAIDPATTMPDLGVGERDARDMAAWLRRLH